MKTLARSHVNPDGTHPAFLAIWDMTKEASARDDLIAREDDTAWGGHYTAATILVIKPLYKPQYKSDPRHQSLRQICSLLGIKLSFDNGKPEYNSENMLLASNGQPPFAPQDHLLMVAKSRFSSKSMIPMHYIGKYTLWGDGHVQ
jgi:hypothetical protein